MHPDLDLQLIREIPALLRMQRHFWLALDRRLSMQSRMGRSLPSPNLAELALIYCRPRPRLAPWLTGANLVANPNLVSTPTAYSSTTLSVSDLLILRNELTRRLTARGVVPKTKLLTLATYLAVTPCPTISHLSAFACIHPSRAKVWLQRVTDLSLLKCHKKPNELIFLNLHLVSALANLSPERVGEQFESTVSRGHWLKRSVYRSV
jgi:hypothetical protein